MDEAPNTSLSRNNESQCFALSVKGVVILDSRVLLRKNERDEWELPGGKLEIGETPEECVIREFQEETGITITVESLLGCWVYRIAPDIHVVVVTYGCYTNAQTLPNKNELAEPNELDLFRSDELASLKIPNGYKKVIQQWFYSH